MDGPPPSFAQLEFRVRHTPARAGEHIYAVGEHPSLGCWDPGQAIKLHMEESGVWVSREPVSVPTGVAMQYKYLLFLDGRLERWEAFDGNRVIVASSARRRSRHRHNSATWRRRWGTRSPQRRKAADAGRRPRRLARARRARNRHTNSLRMVRARRPLTAHRPLHPAPILWQALAPRERACSRRRTSSTCGRQ